MRTLTTPGATRNRELDAIDMSRVPALTPEQDSAARVARAREQYSGKYPRTEAVNLDVAADRLLDGVQGICARTACKRPGAICRHTQYPHRMYCVPCARKINDQPGQAGLVEIPPLEERRVAHDAIRAAADLAALPEDVKADEEGEWDRTNVPDRFE